MSHDILEVLTTQIQRKRKELERLQQVAAAIPQVQQDLEALERTLAILRPSYVSDTASQPPTLRQSYTSPSEPYPQLAEAILRERGTPLTGDQIFQIAQAQQAQGKTVIRKSLMGGLYRLVKEGKLFKLVAPGKFGLLEWDNPPQERERDLSVPLEEMGGAPESRYDTAPLNSSNGAV